jgi:hypothetical protein
MLNETEVPELMKVPGLHETMVGGLLTVHPAGRVPSTVVLLGNVYAIVPSVACDGPALEMVNVAVPVVPGTRDPGPLTAAERSALGRMLPVNWRVIEPSAFDAVTVKSKGP